jgi:hypothetical protein
LEGTTGRVYMGALPAAGQWVQLKVPASQVALEGSTVKGMAFTLFGGRATWDAAGRLAPGAGSTSVSVSATGPSASRIYSSPGTFTVSRTGDTSAQLAVSFTLGGSAVGGADYKSVSSSFLAPLIVFPAGVAAVNLPIVPLTTSNIVGPQMVVLNLATNSAYTVSSPAAAIAIQGNTIKPTSFSVTQAGPTLTWPTISNRIYRIAYKNTLTDQNWVPAGPDILANGPSGFWIDQSSNRPGQRFYTVAQLH